jgi:nucleoside phosphorylase
MNAYSTGVIGRHNVVLAHMPGIGIGSAASVASCCKISFPNITLALVVGVCGIVPSGLGEGERVLGDVVISDGVVLYHFGEQMAGYFERKDTVNDSIGRPNSEIRATLAKLKGLRGRKRLNNLMAQHIGVLQQEPLLAAHYPGKIHDTLFEASYKHADKDIPCNQSGCNGGIVVRQRLLPSRNDPLPIVHFGLVASGDCVMKSGEDRDKIAQREGVIAFEMEGGGAWDSFPCLVIKGACDYADGHMNKLWRTYAAATAAACLKGFLESWVLPEGVY